jgi:hypothetical protein
MKKNTVERMTSTDETHFSLQQPLVSTIGTQTDIECTTQLNDQISKTVLKSSKDIYFLTEPIHNLIEFEAHAPQKVTSLTELISTSGKTNIEIFHSSFLFFSSYPTLTWSST